LHRVCQLLVGNNIRDFRDTCEKCPKQQPESGIVSEVDRLANRSVIFEQMKATKVVAWDRLNLLD
jgi:hypothetical protein